MDEDERVAELTRLCIGLVTGYVHTDTEEMPDQVLLACMPTTGSDLISMLLVMTGMVTAALEDLAMYTGHDFDTMLQKMALAAAS